MPRYLHIPHTPDTARTLTLSGRNCLVVSGMTTPPSLKSATGAEKGAKAKCVHKARRSPTAGLLREQIEKYLTETNWAEWKQK